MSATGILICDDLFFSSKVTGTAGVLGLKVDVVESIAELTARLAETAPQCVILDLSMQGLKPADVIAALPTENRPTVIAFGSHVMTEQLQAAKDAGCDEVMPKSRFSSELSDILRRNLSSED